MTKNSHPDLLLNFSDYIRRENLFQPNDKILLAVSGGIDSVAMAELFHLGGYHFSIAHCNFKLRGKESEADERFVKALAKKYKVPFYSKKFLTQSFAKKNKLSIQEAARNLRYSWFYEIRIKKNFRCIGTAHNLDDNIETFFINLFRGTGISGLAGMEPHTEEEVVRPLLFASRKEIEQFVKEHKLKYREDRSNATDDYLRNKIRHHLIPVLNKLNPAFQKTMTRTLHNLFFADHVFNMAIIEKTIQLSHLADGTPYFSRKELQSLEFPEDYLYEFLSPFHFNAAQIREIWECKQSGKIFNTDYFRVICDRDKIRIAFKPSPDDTDYAISKEEKTFRHKTFSLKFRSIAIKAGTQFKIPSDHTVACLDLSLLRFPLTVRRWKAGDSFFPLGMSHHKKLSDFFIDKKFSVTEKENTFVLLSGKEIVSVLGHRVDDRFKVTERTKKVLRIDYLSKLK